jgi:hypothetical protein
MSIRKLKIYIFTLILVLLGSISQAALNTYVIHSSGLNNSLIAPSYQLDLAAVKANTIEVSLSLSKAPIINSTTNSFTQNISLLNYSSEYNNYLPKNRGLTTSEFLQQLKNMNFHQGSIYN